MKIDIAVYTAQEGYSWQPGTVLTSAELKGYKEWIGKFPSPDAADFQFGGIFLKDDHVVFYRYHVAKKIDFRGRDALYCVLGRLPKSEASKVSPMALFSLPQFAAPMQPFPTSAELENAAPDVVPAWLKNLDIKTLEVRITGTIDDMNFSVAQKDVPRPVEEPPVVAKPSDVAKPVANADEASPKSPNVEKVESPAPKVASTQIQDRRKSGLGCTIRTFAILGIAVLTMFVSLALLILSLIRGCGESKQDTNKDPSEKAEGIAAQFEKLNKVPLQKSKK